MPRKSKHAIPDEKKALLLDLIETYEVKTTADLQEALKDLLGETIQTMLEQEIDTQIDEREEQDTTYSDSRNGYKDKTLRSKLRRDPDPGSTGSKQRLRAKGGTEVPAGHLGDRGEDYRDVRAWDEHAADLGSGSGYIWVRS